MAGRAGAARLALLACLAFAFLPAGCGFLFGGEVRLRIHNVSAVPFERVVVSFPQQIAYGYGSIAPGEATAYRKVEGAYPYGRIEVTVDGHTLVLQPIDFVGERRLRSGSYTYEVDADLDTAQLSLRLVVD